MTAPSRCGSCQAPVFWAVTRRGKNMPVDPDPSDRGNVVLAHHVNAGAARVALVLNGEQLALIANGTTVTIDAQEHRPYNPSTMSSPDAARMGFHELAVDDGTPRYLSHFATCTHVRRGPR